MDVNLRYWVIGWGNYVADSNWWDFGCYIDESGGVLKWPTKMGDILGVIPPI